MNFGNGGEGFLASVFEGVAEGGDAQDSAAAGDEPAVIERGAGVEDHGVGSFGGIFQAGDFDAFFHLVVGLPAVAFAGEHDADGGAFVPLEGDAVELALDGGEHDFHQVALEPHHERLAFGIAEAGVELDDLGAGGGEHEADVEESVVIDFVASQRVEKGDDDFALDFVEEIVGEERGGGEGAHAAGVGAGVIIADAFVVLGGFKEVGVLAVDEGEEGDFGAFEALFDDDGVAGGAEDSFLHDVADGVEGFDGVGADDDALTACEAGGFDDEGLVAGFDEGDGGLEAGEGAAFGGGDGGVAHDFFGEGFVGFELSRRRERGRRRGYFFP